MTRRWSLRMVACLAVGAALLAGCSAKQEANESLPSVSSTAQKPELPPLGPDSFPVPDEARQKTPEGALAFAKYYIALGSEVGAGNAPAKAMLDLSSQCQLCQQAAASFQQDQDAGYRYRAPYTFDEYALPRLSDNTAELGFVYRQDAYTVVDAAGNEIPDRAGEATGDLQSGMLLEWRSNLHGWVVTTLTIG